MDDELDCMEAVLTHYGMEPKHLDSSWRSVLCPFHGDIRPSARAKDTGFACLACGIKGNVITLVMKVEQVEANRAFEILEELTGESHRRVSKPVTRKSWGVPPFSEGDKPRVNQTFQTGIRRFPDLGG